LWLVVVSSCLSMYGYFRAFYLSVMAGNAAGQKVTQPGIAAVRE